MHVEGRRANVHGTVALLKNNFETNRWTDRAEIMRRKIESWSRFVTDLRKVSSCNA